MRIVFDLDGTLCTQTQNGEYEKAKPFSNMIEVVNKLYDLKHTIIIQTARGMGICNGDASNAYEKFFTLTKTQLDLWNVKYHELKLGKVEADLYVDDKSLRVDGNLPLSAFAVEEFVKKNSKRKENINMVIIPARGGSKGISKKNIKRFAGKPLVAWTIEQALEAHSVDKVVVSTDHDDIASVSRAFGAEVHRRSAENAKDEVHAVHAILECLEFYKKQDLSIKNVAMLLATSPVRDPKDIDACFTMLGRDCDSVVSVVSFEKPMSSLRDLGENSIISPIIDVNHYETRRQDIDRMLYEVNGSIFASNVEHLKKTKSFHQGRVMGYKMPASRSFDINNMDDWEMAEAYALYEKGKL